MHEARAGCAACSAVHLIYPLYCQRSTAVGQLRLDNPLAMALAQVSVMYRTVLFAAPLRLTGCSPTFRRPSNMGVPPAAPANVSLTANMLAEY